MYVFMGGDDYFIVEVVAIGASSLNRDIAMLSLISSVERICEHCVLMPTDSLRADRRPEATEVGKVRSTVSCEEENHG